MCLYSRRQHRSRRHFNNSSRRNKLRISEEEISVHIAEKCCDLHTERRKLGSELNQEEISE